MKSQDSLDIERSLTELSDEQAIAIMEGREPAVSADGIDAAAYAMTRQLLADDNQSAQGGGGTRVTDLIGRQPWMRMAAALALGVALTSLVRAPPQLTAPSTDAATASANVVYLETSRSAAPEIPIVTVRANEPWVTLVVYPDFEGADLLRLQVERAPVRDNRSPDSLSPDAWEVVVDVTSGLGTQDSVVLTIGSDRLASGSHRLKVFSATGDRDSLVSTYMFLVEK